MYWTTLSILIIIVLAYILVGGAIFMALEKRHETSMKIIAHSTFYDFISNNTCVTAIELEAYTASVISAYDFGVMTSSNKSTGSNWDYGSASFFAMTIITAIGYGHMSPSTPGGQAFFIVYAVVGIPLCITVLIGIGERLSRPYKSLERTRDCTRHHKTEKMVKIIIFTLLYFIIFSIIPAAIITNFENWTYLESWYYTIVTLTTVGFGDYVPGEQSSRYEPVYKIATGIWIFCGLAWLATVFHMAVHFVKLLTNKIDSVTHHQNGIERESKQVQTSLQTKDNHAAAQSATNSETD